MSVAAPVGSPATVAGPMRFARYAFGPNRLGLCGPEDWRSLLELGTTQPGTTGTVTRDIDRGLRDLACRFEGAYPYLELIAAAHGIADPMDDRVVEAYWLGNALSDSVDPGVMLRSMEHRFEARLTPKAWAWLRDKPASGAHPTHAFHVLDVFPRVGALRGGDSNTDVIGLMDACRIRWGRVLEVTGEWLSVDVVPLSLAEGQLRLADPRPQTVRRWLDGSGFVTDVRAGDTVSVHWDWACEVLRPSQAEALRRRTLHQLRIANATI